MGNFSINHPNIFGRLYIIAKILRIGFVSRKFDNILKKQREKGLVLVKNISGRTIKKGEFVGYNDVRLLK